MRTIELSPSTLMFVVGTRVAIGLGVGLLLADRIPPGRRRALAMTLIGFGAATTVPAARAVFGHRRLTDGDRGTVRQIEPAPDHLAD